MGEHANSLYMIAHQLKVQEKRGPGPAPDRQVDVRLPGGAMGTKRVPSA